MKKTIDTIATDKTTIDSFKYSGAQFKALPDGWRLYGPIDVSNNGGSMITEGTFSKVQVCMDPTVVNYSPIASTTLPGPNPMTSPKPTFTYPEAPQFDLVIVQCEGGVPEHGQKAEVTYTPMLASATSLKDAQTIELNNSKNVFIAFNDLVGAYYDNSGEVYVRVKFTV
jgi:hypothetical protein